MREKCSRNRSLLLGIDMLGDTSLPSHSQARYLLHLLNPYCSYETSADSAQLARMDSGAAMEHILKVYRSYYHIAGNFQFSRMIFISYICTHLASGPVDIEQCSPSYLVPYPAIVGQTQYPTGPPRHPRYSGF